MYTSVGNFDIETKRCLSYHKLIMKGITVVLRLSEIGLITAGVFFFFAVIGGIESNSLPIYALGKGLAVVAVSLLGAFLIALVVIYIKEQEAVQTKEKNFENKVKDFLRNEGVWYVKYWGGGKFTTAGIPDLLCCVNGLFVGIELKADNGTPSELQLYTIEKIKEAGGIAFVLYPKAFAQLKQLIYDLESRKPLEELEVVWK